MRRALALSCLALACLLVGSVPTAGAATKVKVGTVRLAHTPAGHESLLIPVTYPIEIANRHLHLSVGFFNSRGQKRIVWIMPPVANAGPLRTPERRKRFVHVHRIDLLPRETAQMERGSTLRITARAHLDADDDGEYELRAEDARTQPVPRASGGNRICSTPSKRWMRPGRVTEVTLPICTDEVRWSIAERPRTGSARIRGNRLIYNPGRRFRGTASITLSARHAGASVSVTPTDAVVPVQVTVSSAGSPVVRAFGDSVTAGFGYYEHGEPMPFTNLLSCKPGETAYDDACSSNSTVRSNKAAKIEYAKDYGLSNNVSWAAQWANAHGLSDYKNFAVSGSEPSDWFGQGQFAATFEQLASEDPDYVLFTMGANPLLSNMLFGVGNIGCGVWADFFGRFQECVEEEFEEIKLRQNLTTLYENLVKETDAQIFVMQYHLSIPTAALYGVEQIAEMGNLMNAEIATVARKVDPKGTRITVVSPPHFNVGLGLGQAYPSTYKCEGRFFSSVVDGPSVQATPSQTEMGDAHPIEFCAQPKGEVPWVISGDTGIHPSAAGYQQMASEVPAPK